MDYRYIRAWGVYLGTRRYYVRQAQMWASLERAPERAIYKDADDVWKTVDDIMNEHVKEHIITLASRR